MNAEAEFYRRQHGDGVDLTGRVVSPEAERAFAPEGRYSLVVERIALLASSNDTVVELGCGGGETLLYLTTRHRFARAVGIDVAIKAPVDPGGIEFRNDNLNNRWPLENASIDYLIAMMVFEHLFDPFHCFQEVRRTLSDRGFAYVNVPLVTSLRNRVRLMLGLLPETSVGYERWFKDRIWDGNHLHYFSMESLHRLSDACDLNIVKIRGVGRGYRLKSALPSLLASEITIELQKR